MIKGVGVDIVRLDRFERSQEQLAIKILTEKELVFYRQLSIARSTEWLAGRFALKEAIFKANHDSSLTIHQIEISQDEQGAPICKLKGCIVHCSISHEKAYAIAYACIEYDPR